MARKKCFIYEQDIIVYRNSNKSFIVNFCDEFEIRITQKEIDEIITSDEPDEIIAILIATIKEKYQETRGCSKEKITKLKKSEINETLNRLLENGYIPEELIQIFQQLKWHYIVRVFKSDNPEDEYEQVKETV